jgi:hypothetical protein
MTPIHILFAKMLVKMFHMSLEYIHLLHVSISLGHPQVTFFFKESIALHTVTRTLKYAVVYLFLVLYGAPSSYFLYCGCSLQCIIYVY